MSEPVHMSVDEAAREFALATRLRGDIEVETIAVFRGPTVLAQLDLAAMGPCIVAGDLEVTGDILGMDEEAGFLVVLGNCSARNLVIGAPEVWIERDLIVANGLLADYNHGLLTVGGNLSATIVLAEHTVRIAGTVTGTSVDFGGLRVADPTFTPTLSRDAAVYHARDHFIPAALSPEGYLSGRQLSLLLLAGTSPLRS